jgi:uncharacterized membrane protein
MSWFFVALVAPFLFSIVNHAEKIILSRFFRGSGSGGLMIFIGVVAVPVAIAIRIFIGPTASNLSDSIILIGSGFLFSVASFLFLKTLEDHDASYVVPFWQLTPVFAFFFGIVLLEEYIETGKIAGSLIVICGAIFLSFNFSGKKVSFDFRSIITMTLSSLTLALSYVSFKFISIEAIFWESLFWNQIGIALFSFVFFLVPKYREEFFISFRENSHKIMALNTAVQVVDLAGVIVANFAVRLAPAAIVILVEYSFQPLFVFLLGLIFSVLFPKFVSEDLSRRVVLQRFIAILFMTGGLLFVV